MNITLISTNDIQGGAARATYRLHKGLIQIGQNVTMLSRKKASDDDHVYQIEAIAPDDSVALREITFDVIQKQAINAHRSDLSNTIFLIPYPGIDLSQVPTVQEADVINLHWVARFQSPSTLNRLLQLGKPVVWTLHDMWALTGGCHYSAGCCKYQNDCGDCLQLTHDPSRLAAAVLADKVKHLQGFTNLTLATPSQWLADCVRESHVFQDFRVEVIPYGLETDVFVPIPKAIAKETLGISPDVTTLLFGAVYKHKHNLLLY